MVHEEATWAVLHVSITNFYDVPLEGWLRATGHYWYFLCDTPTAELVHYAVYDVPKPVRVAHLQHHRKFRHMVGWHWDYAPAGQATPDAFSASSRPQWLDFYKLPAPPDIDLALCRFIGTTDLRTLTLT